MHAAFGQAAALRNPPQRDGRGVFGGAGGRACRRPRRCRRPRGPSRSAFPAPAPRCPGRACGARRNPARCRAPAGRAPRRAASPGRVRRAEQRRHKVEAALLQHMLGGRRHADVDVVARQADERAPCHGCRCSRMSAPLDMPAGPAVLVSLSKPDASQSRERRVATEARPYRPGGSKVTAGLVLPCSIGSDPWRGKRSRYQKNRRSAVRTFRRGKPWIPIAFAWD